MLPGGYLTLVIHNSPPGTGQSSCIMEATPGFLCLSDVSWFIICFSLHNGKGEESHSKFTKKLQVPHENYSTELLLAGEVSGEVSKVDML